MLRRLRQAVGWVLVIVGGLMLMSSLICILLVLLNMMDELAAEGLVSIVTGLGLFALLGLINGVMVFLGWRMRGTRRVLIIPLRCRVAWIRPWLRRELSRVRGRACADLRPKNLNQPVGLEKADGYERLTHCAG